MQFQAGKFADGIIGHLLDGGGLVLFEGPHGRELHPGVVEAAALSGRETELAVLDLTSTSPPDASIDHLVGLDIARGMSPGAASAFVADLAVPVGIRSADPGLHGRVRSAAAAYLSIRTGVAASLSDLADLADLPGGGDPGVRLALARLQLHLHRHGHLLGSPSAWPVPPLDVESAGKDRAILVVRHNGRSDGDLLAALANLLGRGCSGTGGPLMAVRQDRPRSIAPGWMAGLGGLSACDGGWTGPVPCPPPRRRDHLERLCMLRQGYDSRTRVDREGLVATATRDGQATLAYASGDDVAVFLRERGGWAHGTRYVGRAGRPVTGPIVSAMAVAALRGGLEACAAEGGVMAPGAGEWERSAVGIDDVVRAGVGSTRAGRRFLAGIDLDLRTACLSANAGASLHGWVARSGDRRSARRDFVVTWRSLAGLARRPDVEATVDAGDRTMPVVARILGITEAKARRLRGRPRLPDGWADDPARAGIVLGSMDVNRIPPPGDGMGWDAFVDCVDRLDEFRHRLSHHPDDGLGALLNGPGRGWDERLSALERAGDVTGAAQMVRALATHLLSGAPEIPPRQAEIAALGLLAGNGSLAGLTALATRWLADPVIGDAGSGTVGDPLPWEPLFDGIVCLPGGGTARALSTPEHLRMEGGKGPDPDGFAGLDHCVEGHAHACAAGRSHIVSLRAHDGSRVSTAEIVTGPEGGVVLGQHRGRGNAEPPPWAWEACDWLVTSLRSGRIPVTALAGSLSLHASGVPASRRSPRRLHERWRPFIAGERARLPFEGLVAGIAVDVA